FKQCTDLPWYFLKRLMMFNVTCINVKCTSVCESNSDNQSGSTDLDLFNIIDSSNTDDMVNPLDIITALFLCSDSFLQQEMALKMSMCQFSVPLLLPNCDTGQCTLMLWAMRDIVKKYRPQSLSQSKGFIEERIVLSELPMVSFVRLGECSLSKSEILNKLLSNAQQYHDTFVHHNMECGDSPRRISNGLTEITWYLPCGNTNIDIFSQPVAVANLHGDIASFEIQYSFLCQTSAAVFVFFDHLDSESEFVINLFKSQNHKAPIFLVGNGESKHFSLEALRKLATKLNLNKNNIIITAKQKDDADFVKYLRKTVRNVVEKSEKKMKMEKMVNVAHELGILVDEDAPECQTAKKNAEAITAEIQDIHTYKEDQLPRHKDYKRDIQKQKEVLRQKQNSYEISTAMTNFITGISSPGTERFYFLKWMQMNLNNVPHIKLSELREKYKEKCKNSEIKENCKSCINKLISSISLGTEHFFREMGQIYEASLSLPETDPVRQQFQHLPKLCAELLLDGFPLELVDGDASNIPLRWVSDVLSQLSDLVSPNRKILVVTVLGVQSTGKSTLLNTMFGVQFAVSSGRCTRGAFMLLIKINEDMKNVLNCDYMVIIDTEGLKSPELAQLDNSYEHDNELATLVVGLSDVTIVNIAMENLIEMKDILQIVVHAFLRMKEVGKKPKCQFVHQNVSDVSAHEKNLQDRKLLLKQLNEMTQAAAKMEKKEGNKSFTDVMEYSPDTGNWYIPGPWNGNPPMAPVNAGYSEAVYELKKNIIQLLRNCESSANNIMEFKEWVKSLWNAVKHENFIFSFRNSLVADAYMKLCTEFNKWEWEFRKEMYTWVTNAETKIYNFGTIAAKSEKSDMREFLRSLKSEASTVLSAWETKILENLTQYFKQTEGHVYLVEGYKEEFSNSAKILHREIESSVKYQLEAAAENRKGMTEINKIKDNHTKEIKKAVRELIDKCQKKKVQMTDTELDKEFEKMWSETLDNLSFSEQKTSNVTDKVSHYLRENLKHRGNTCTDFVNEQVKRKNNYHDTYIQEIIHMIDEKLKKNQDVKITIEFEVSLKQHICGFAARKFQKMHEDFIEKNDPHRCLAKNKEKFNDDFKDVFHERDQCQKKAEEFTNLCLKPAVEDFVHRSLGLNVIDEMRKLEQFSTQMFFQYSVLLDLLSKEDFQSYLSYISSYEKYVKSWILEQIKEHFSNESTVFEFEDQHLQSCVKCIISAINKAKTSESDDLKAFVEDICKELGDKLVISQDALGAFMILNNADKEQFAHWLTTSVNDMPETLRKKFKESAFEMKLQHLHVNPQNELFNKLIGCGKQCPFCKAPCDAGGKVHTEHFASLHRPKGLGRYKWDSTKNLVTDICSSSVISENRFCCNDTNNEWHPYKKYKEIYKDWNIQADVSLEASDYWKHVMTKYNSDFAKEYKAEPANIPETWHDINKDKAEKSLKESFYIN
uniref:VLIG-type G domain-containing protein n=1 Tax=Neolamprologus brichardi TaxID=32507 RepID=A0A3Q4GYG9_NEOBR